MRPRSTRSLASRLLRSQLDGAGTGEKAVDTGIGASQRSDAGDVAEAIEDLHKLDAASLAKRWRALVGGAIPNDLGRPLTLRVLAYKLQAQRLGDLDKASEKELSTIYRRAKAPIGSAPDMSAAGLKGTNVTLDNPMQPMRYARPGTLLTREHGGVIHRVMVMGDGVVWNGRTYESLSKVAFAITGTRWNGPRFFGLRDKAADGRSQSQQKARPERPSDVIGRGRAALLARGARRAAP